MSKAKRNIFIALFLLPVIVMFCTVYAVPLIITIASSFTKWDGFTPMTFIGLKNYQRLFGDSNFTQSMINTLKWAACAAFIHVPFGVLISLFLSKKLKGWRFTRAAFMVPNIISQSSLAILFLFVFKPDGGIINSIVRLFGNPDFAVNWLFDPNYAFLAVTQTWLWYAAVIVLITLAELLSISPSLHEAARIDGANNFQIDWYINLPLIRRIIGTGMVIAITSVFKMFDVIYITTNGGPGNSTMNLAVMMVNAVILENRYGFANAIGLVLLVMGAVVMGASNKIFGLGKSDDY